MAYCGHRVLAVTLKRITTCAVMKNNAVFFILAHSKNDWRVGQVTLDNRGYSGLVRQYLFFRKDVQK